MSLAQKLFSELERQGKKPADLAKLLGVGNNVLSSWKTRDTDPPVKYLIQICDFINMDVLTFLTGQPSQKALTQEQVELLDQWEQLDENGRIIIRAKIIEELRRLGG